MSIVVETRVDHYLSFVEFRHRDARRAARDLFVCELGDFVRLRVRPQSQIVFVTVRGHPRQIPLHHFEIDDQRRRVEFVY